MYTEYANEEDVFEKAKRRSLIDFLEGSLGVPAKVRGHRARMDSCPSCGASSLNSLKLQITSDRYWHCYQCGKSGSIIDAAMEMYADCRSPLEAARYVSQGRTQRVASPESIARDRKADSVRLEWGKWVSQRIHSASRDGFDQSVYRYLTQTRGLAPHVVQEAWHRGILAALPESRVLGTQWLQKVVGDDSLRYAGLWKPDSDQPWIAGRPLIQFTDNHELAEFRIIYKPAPGAKTKKTLSVGVPGAPFFWRGSDASQCLVVEGCIEMLAGVTMGYAGHVVGTAGTGGWNLEWFKALGAQGVKHFDLAFNNDFKPHDPDKNPGQESQKELAHALTNEGLGVRDASPVEPGDLNDALLRKKLKR